MVWASSIRFLRASITYYIKKTSIPVVVTPRLFASRVLYSPSPRCRVCVCVCVSSHHDLPPLKAATTDAALGGRVGSASLLNMFLTGGTQTGNAAPTKPKAHDHTTIGSLCKNVVQNPAMSFSSGGCFFSFRSSALSGRQKRKRGVKTHGRSRVFEEEDFRSFRKKRQKDEGSRGGKKEQEEKHIFSPRRKINKSFVSSKSSL